MLQEDQFRFEFGVQDQVKIKNIRFRFKIVDQLAANGRFSYTDPAADYRQAPAHPDRQLQAFQALSMLSGRKEKIYIRGRGEWISFQPEGFKKIHGKILILWIQPIVTE